MHPFYGDIGTLTDTIDRAPEATRSDWRLRIAVKLLGIVVYRQEFDTTEIMHGNRLTLLQSVTDKDGRQFYVDGGVQGDRFVVNATAGSFAGPVTIAPSDPWALKRLGEATVIYINTGRIINVRVSGGDFGTISVNGSAISAQHFTVIGDQRQDVWLDDRKIPVMFRVLENGAPIDFLLQGATVPAGIPRSHP